MFKQTRTETLHGRRTSLHCFRTVICQHEDELLALISQQKGHTKPLILLSPHLRENLFHCFCCSPCHILQDGRIACLFFFLCRYPDKSMVLLHRNTLQLNTTIQMTKYRILCLIFWLGYVLEIVSHCIMTG